MLNCTFGAGGGDHEWRQTTRGGGGTTPRRRPRRAGRLPGRQDWSSWPHYQAAAAGLPRLLVPGLLLLAGHRQAEAGHAARREDRADPRRRHRLRAQGPVPAPRRSAQPGRPAVPGHDLLPVPRLDVRPGDRRPQGRHHRRAAVADLRQGHPADLRRRRAARHGVGVRRRRRGRPADRRAAARGAGRQPGGASASRIQPRVGNWRFACENGYDEGHAKYLHRTSLWRLFKADAGVERDPDRAPRPVDLPGAGQAVLDRGVPRPRPLGQPGLVQAQAAEADRQHRQHRRPPRGQPGDRRPGVPGVRVGEHARGCCGSSYPTFIHYEFYVPVDADNHLVRRRDGRVPRGPAGAALLPEVPRVRPVAVPRPVLRAGQVDGRDDRRPARSGSTGPTTRC